MFLRRLRSLLILLILAAMAGGIGYYFWQASQPKENPFDPIIVQVSREIGVDPFLIRALIWRESRFKPMTHGTAADERGLMQVTPEVGRMWAKENKIANFQPDDLYDPATNIRVGTWYLNRALRKWSQTDDPITFALAEYNAGRTNAIRWVDPADPQNHVAFMARISYPSTQKYVETILMTRDQYREQLAKNRWYREFASANTAMTAMP